MVWRHGIKPGHQRLQLLAAYRVDVEAKLLRVGEYRLVLQRRGKRLTQRCDAIRRYPGRHRYRAAERVLGCRSAPCVRRPLSVFFARERESGQRHAHPVHHRMTLEVRAAARLKPMPGLGAVFQCARRLTIRLSRFHLRTYPKFHCSHFFMFAIWAPKGALVVVRLFVGKNVDDEHCRAAYRTRRTVNFNWLRNDGAGYRHGTTTFLRRERDTLSHRRLDAGPAGDETFCVLIAGEVERCHYFHG